MIQNIFYWCVLILLKIIIFNIFAQNKTGFKYLHYAMGIDTTKEIFVDSLVQWIMFCDALLSVISRKDN